MKVSLNTVRFLNERYGSAADPAVDGVDALVKKIGAQLGAVDEVIEFGKYFEEVVVAKIAACEPHPNADRLKVCAIDDGGNTPDVKRDENGHVQVVCGAPNAREGLLVAWLPPGSTVPETIDKEPFVLEARELRGVVSNGMIASARELCLGGDHSGILEITLDADEHVKPGMSFAEAYHLTGDIILDIENKMFTHRPDCFGFLGIARELAGIQHGAYRSPDWYTPDPEFPGIEADPLPLSVINELPSLVPRFTAITLRDVKVGPSPTWLQVDLARVGQKPINNIVDYANWFMLLTGQPLHAYDYDKVAALSGGQPTLAVRNPRGGEKIKLLNGKEVEPRAEAIMIATDKQLIGIGGVMGGSETEVSDDTKNIILECANFDMYSIRRTSMAHGLFTDAVTRFTKGQSPLQTRTVLGRIVAEIRQFADGKVAGEVIDDNHVPEAVQERQSLHPPVSLPVGFINDRLGSELSAAEVQRLLKNVEFKVEVQDDTLTVTAPFWRTDIELREDIVEEVGRLYGFDKLPLALPERDLTPAVKDPLLELKAALRSRLTTFGANELLTYSFVHDDLLQKVGQDPAQSYSLSNALSPDLQYYRLSLTPSLLEKVHPNVKAGYDNFALFEIGKTHVLGQETDGVPTEFERLALVFAAGTKAAGRLNGAAYYEAKKYLSALLESFGLAGQVSFEPLAADDPDSAAAYYEPTRAAVIRVGERVIGRIGEYKASVRTGLKLPMQTAGFELGLGPLLELQSGKPYVTLPRFPKVTQDITLKVPAELAYQKLFDFIHKAMQANQPNRSLSSLEPVDIFQKEDDRGHKQVTLRLTIANYDRTLTDQEVNKLLDAAAEAAKTELSVERI